MTSPNLKRGAARRERRAFERQLDARNPGWREPPPPDLSSWKRRGAARRERRAAERLRDARDPGWRERPPPDLSSYTVSGPMGSATGMVTEWHTGGLEGPVGDVHPDDGRQYRYGTMLSWDEDVGCGRREMRWTTVGGCPFETD